MSTKVKGYFNKMLKMEESARDLYKEYIKKFKNPALVSDIRRIEKQEELHVTMVRQLLQMLEEGK